MSITIVEKEGESKEVVEIQLEGGENVLRANLDNLSEKIDVKAILANDILEKYSSMIASLMISSGTAGTWEQAFADVYLYALALKVKSEGEGE
jgi:hypothetical protein